MMHTYIHTHIVIHMYVCMHIFTYMHTYIHVQQTAAYDHNTTIGRKQGAACQFTMMYYGFIVASHTASTTATPLATLGKISALEPSAMYVDNMPLSTDPDKGKLPQSIRNIMTAANAKEVRQVSA
jgi:hypothetical protein